MLASKRPSTSQNNAEESVPYTLQQLSLPYRVPQRFFCWGFLVAGPNWKSCFGSAAILSLPTVVFLYFIAPYLASRVNVGLLVVG